MAPSGSLEDSDRESQLIGMQNKETQTRDEADAITGDIRSNAQKVIERNKGWGELPEKQSPDIEEAQWRKNLSPSDLVAIHVSNTFPSDEKVRSHVGWTEYDGRKLKGARDTIHFTLNQVVVESHGIAAMGSEWRQRKFAILSPLDGFEKEQIVNFRDDDTFIEGDFDLPEGTTVLTDWKQAEVLRNEGLISQEEMLQLLNQMGVMDRYNLTSGKPMQEVIIEKNGIKYILCDLSGKAFRDRIVKEIKNMGYRNVSPDPGRAFREKYDLLSGSLHSEHQSMFSEQISTYILKLLSHHIIFAFHFVDNDENRSFEIWNIKEKIREIVTALDRFPEDKRSKRHLVNNFRSYLSILLALVDGIVIEGGYGQEVLDEFEDLQRFIETTMKENHIQLSYDDADIADLTNGLISSSIKNLRTSSPSDEAKSYIREMYGEEYYESGMEDISDGIRLYGKMINPKYLSEGNKKNLKAAFENVFFQLKLFFSKIDPTEKELRKKIKELMDYVDKIVGK